MRFARVVKSSLAAHLCVAFLQACTPIVVATGASAPLAPAIDSHHAKEAAPPDGMARIYIVRKAQTYGSTSMFTVTVDGQRNGPLTARGYRYVDVPQGRHRITIYAAENEVAREIEAVAGERYFLLVRAVEGSLLPRVAFASDDLAPRQLREAQLVQ